MTDDQQLIEPGAETANPDSRNERREFFKAALGAAAVTAAGASALAIATSASAATIADNDIFVFLCQLDYLAGEYFSFATTGTGLSPALLTGQTADTVGAATGARRVTFTDPVVTEYAAEITRDLVANITYIRAQLGTDGVRSQPAIDLGTSATSAFGKLATAAGIDTAGAFDPYASDGNFLLGAFMIEDVLVTAYIGAITVISDKTLLAAASGILATHAHHAAVIRALLYAKGATTPSLRTSADKISNVRDNLDGTTDLDQGISPTTVSGNLVSNVVPAAPNGSILGRSTGNVLNEYYLNSASVSLGGFFTAGLNGTIKASTAN
ncbi:ferritin-like domain-containing protein [Sphingomonas oligophenolica]|uniref:Ferritin-like domain-containing protein n=1 Tax=Sphingomonas oligophenolica TaxID=301154 RepID=A0ABU9Y8Z4_9SPHN